jgi:hypothetical protein
MKRTRTGALRTFRTFGPSEAVEPIGIRRARIFHQGRSIQNKAPYIGRIYNCYWLRFTRRTANVVDSSGDEKSRLSAPRYVEARGSSRKGRGLS